MNVVVLLGALFSAIILHPLAKMNIDTRSFNNSVDQWWELEQRSAAYCNKKSGECFFQEFTCNKEPEGCFVHELEWGNSYQGLSTEEFIPEDFDLVLLNVFPVFHIKDDIRLNPNESEPAEQFVLASEIETSGYSFFRQITEFPDGKKQTEFTGYGPFQSSIVFKHGTYHQWYENGQKQLEADFRFGKLWGNATVWYENGIKKQEANYVADKLHNTAKYYNDNGMLLEEYTYNQGKLVHRKTYDPDNNESDKPVSGESSLLFDSDYRGN